MSIHPTGPESPREAIDAVPGESAAEPSTGTSPPVAAEEVPAPSSSGESAAGQPTDQPEPAVLSEQIFLAERPRGSLGPGTFAARTIELPPLEYGQFLVQVTHLSIDPTIRTWIAFDTYLPKVPLGDVVRSGGCGVVVRTANARYPVGTRVTGMTGWQSMAILERAQPIPEGVSEEDALSLLGATGLTAYIGVFDIARPQQGECMVVSAAGGGVGSVAGQIGRIRGSRVVGIAGTQRKCEWVVEALGFDACINHNEEDVAARLRELCPSGIDTYFDNVGGSLLDTVLAQINDGARIVLCGAIADYDSGKRPAPVYNLMLAIPRRALLQGFIVLDHLNRSLEAAQMLSDWRDRGLLVSKVDVRHGLSSAPEALGELFTGGNIGKLMVRL